MMKKLTLAMLGLILATGAAQADETNERLGFSVGAQVSTLGLGAEAGWRFSDYGGVRANANAFDFSRNQEIEDMDFDLDFKLRSAGVIADLYPFKGGFRLSGGARYNENKIDGRTEDAPIIVINGTPYGSGTVVTGDADYNKFAPYIGAGYDANLGGGFALGFDVGAIYQGKPDVTVRTNNPLVSPTDLAEARQQVKDELDKYPVYPVVSLTLAYRF